MKRQKMTKDEKIKVLEKRIRKAKRSLRDMKASCPVFQLAQFYESIIAELDGKEYDDGLTFEKKVLMLLRAEHGSPPIPATKPNPLKTRLVFNTLLLWRN